MEQKDLIKNWKVLDLYLNGMEAIIIYIQEVLRKKKYQDIKKLMNGWLRQ